MRDAVPYNRLLYEKTMTWMLGTPKEMTTLVKFQQEVFSVVLINEAGEMTILGSSFVVSRLGNHAICFTARHVIDEMCSMTRNRKTNPLAHIPIEDNDDLDINNLVDSGKIKLLTLINGNPYACTVTSISTQPPIDGALLVVELPSNDSNSLNGVLALNSDPLPVGTELILVSFNKQEVKRIGKNEFEVYRETSIRIGKVLSVENTGSPLVKAPVYITNIPCDPGMSGGPVFIYDSTMTRKKEVCGVISSDMSVPESFQSCHVDGHSYVSLIWPFAVLNLRDNENQIKTVLNMVTDGYIVDYGSTVKGLDLKVFPDGKWQLKLNSVIGN
jgi:hypothetical protein